MKSYNTNRNASVLAALQASSFLIMSLLIFCAPNLRAQPIRVSVHAEQERKLRERVRQIYTAQLGIREKGYNSGEAVEKYLRYVKLSRGNPWCAAFVCWVFGQAGVANPRTGWSPDLFPGSKVVWKSGESGYAPSLTTDNQQLTTDIRLTINNRQLTTNKQQLPTPNTPDTGDIFAIYFPEKKRIAHVGFIDQWDGTWMISVEGNTNLAGSREGDGVYRKRRLVRSVYQVARYINP